MIVPADVPLLDADEIDSILEAHKQVTVVPDRDHVGTNCLIATPPDAIPFIFDGRSFKPHVDAAFAAGITPNIIPARGFSLDIDTEADLQELLRRGPPTQTGTFLHKSGIAQRLGALDNSRSGEELR
jgi:2-phospho-L-lactate guanylyltransferase (CobY/MobA/RfbA family)